MDAQIYTLSFSEKNAHEIIEILESELKIDFNYDYGIFDQSIVEDFSASGSKEDILFTCFTLLNKDISLLEDDLYVIKHDDISKEKKIDPVVYKIRLVDDIKTELAYGIARLVGLNVYFETDIDGQLLIEGYFSPEQQIEFSYLGYQSLTIPIKKLKKTKQNTIVLKEEEHMLEEIVIRDKYLIFEEADVSDHIISGDNDGVGGAMDNDVLARSQTIAGVSNTKESLSNLQIRGGIAGQTQLQWNNIELYQSNLFLGNISSINPFMADVIKVNKNGGSADDSSNSSGSIHMQSNHYTGSNSEVKLYSDLLYMNVAASKSFLNNKLRVKAAFRNSITSLFESDYYDQLYKNILQISPVADYQFWIDKYKMENPDNAEIQNKITSHRNVNFGDYSISILAKPTNRMTLDVNYLNIHSNFSFEHIGDENEDGLEKYKNEIKNVGFSAKMKYQLAPFWKSDIVFSRTSLRRLYTYFSNKQMSFLNRFDLQKNGIDQSNIKINQTFKHQNHEWKVGVGYQTWELSVLDFQYSSLREDLFTQANEKSIFLDYTLTIADLIKFKNGTRWSDYSLTFNNRIFIEPRIHVSLFPTKHLTVHAHYGTYHRNMNRQFIGSLLTVEGDFWYLSDEGVSNEDDWLWMVEEAQYSLGMRYSKGPFSIQLDGYKKSSKSIWSQAFEIVNEANPWRYVNANVTGLELSLFYQNDKLSISNTYEIMNDELELEDRSDAFKNPYFQPFKTTFNAEYRFKNFRVAALWNFATGRFYSEPSEIKSKVHKDGYIEYVFIYDERLNEQLKMYHRLDLSCFYTINLLNDISATVGLSVINAYNHKNIISADFAVDWTKNPHVPHRFEREGLPFMPNASFLIEF